MFESRKTKLRNALRSIDLMDETIEELSDRLAVRGQVVSRQRETIGDLRREVRELSRDLNSAVETIGAMGARFEIMRELATPPGQHVEVVGTPNDAVDKTLELLGDHDAKLEEERRASVMDAVKSGLEQAFPGIDVQVFGPFSGDLDGVKEDGEDITLDFLDGHQETVRVPADQPDDEQPELPFDDETQGVYEREVDVPDEGRSLVTSRKGFMDYEG